MTVEKCFKCLKPCNPSIYLWSKRRQKALPICDDCYEKWLKSGRMPK